MFKFMMFGFLAGIIASQQLQDWSSDGIAGARQELRVLLHTDAYEKIGAALR